MGVRFIVDIYKYFSSLIWYPMDGEYVKKPPAQLHSNKVDGF